MSSIDTDKTVLGSAPVKTTVSVRVWDMECLACDGGQFGSWWHTLYYDAEKQRIIAIIQDPDVDDCWENLEDTETGFITKSLSGSKIAKAIAALIENGWDTCYPSGALSEFAATGDFGGGYDSVVADGILQQAIFDEIIYG